MATKIMQDPKLQPQASKSDTPLTVYEMTLSRRGLTEIKGLEKYKKLRVLDASCNKLADTQGIQFNHELREIKLYSNCIAGELKGFQRHGQLVHLLLQDNKISSIGEGLKNLKRLQHLRLDYNLLLKVSPKEFIDCQSLQYLDLSYNILTMFQCGYSLPSLVHLNLAGNKLTMPPSDVQKCQKLEELDISGNPIRAFDTLKGMPHLQVLKLESLNLESLPKISTLKTLQQLHLSNNKFKDLNGIVLRFPNLTVLDVSGNLLSSLEELSHTLRQLPKLQEFIMTGNPIQASVEIRTQLPGVQIVDQCDKRVGQRPATPNQPYINVKKMECDFDKSHDVLVSAQSELGDKFTELFHVLDDLDDKHDSVRPQSCSNSRARLQHARNFATSSIRQEPDHVTSTDTSHNVNAV